VARSQLEFNDSFCTRVRMFCVENYKIKVERVQLIQSCWLLVESQLIFIRRRNPLGVRWACQDFLEVPLRDINPDIL